jgi:hypothetical protein
MSHSKVVEGVLEIDFAYFFSFCVGPDFGLFEHPLLDEPTGVEWMMFIGCETGMPYLLKTHETQIGWAKDVSARFIFMQLENHAVLRDYITRENGCLVTVKRLLVPEVPVAKFNFWDAGDVPELPKMPTHDAPKKKQ